MSESVSPCCGDRGHHITAVTYNRRRKIADENIGRTPLKWSTIVSRQSAWAPIVRHEALYFLIVPGPPHIILYRRYKRIYTLPNPE